MWFTPNGQGEAAQLRGLPRRSRVANYRRIVGDGRQQEHGMAQDGTAATLVTVVNTGQTFRCPPGELILDAGLEAGIGLPHNCRGGACGTCKSQILEGEVDHGWVMSFAISDEEKSAGKCLICQSRPLTPTLVIRPDNAMAPAEEAPLVPMDVRGTVVAADAVSASVRRLVIALPPAIRFRFRAGMHVELKTPGVVKPRTYSMACAPDDQGLPPDGLLEFFITRHERGRASGWLHDALRLGSPIDLHGPYGNFYLPKDAAGPVLCLAGGSGLAPILSVVRRALASGHAEPIELILSVRDRGEVFALDALHALARRHASFTHRVTLTRAREAAPGWRLGRIPDWLGEELPDPARWHVLAAGPPGFVDACVAKAQALGVSPGRILTDSFTPTIA
jgi:ferredoxin-NADP reductase/ferredoxin